MDWFADVLAFSEFGGRMSYKNQSIRFPLSALVCLLACLGLALAKSPALAAIFGVASFGFATAWVYDVHSDFASSGKPIPRWLSTLERIREYLASESGPEIR